MCLNNVLIFSKSVKDHIKHVQEALHLLQDGGVSLKLRKCSFIQKSVDYLGHVLLPERLAVVKDSTSAIADA